VVTAAAYLLYFLAAAQLVSGALGVVLLDGVRDAYEAAYGGAEGRGPASVAVAAGAALGALLAIGYGLLGYLVGRGSNGARITTWVIVGSSLCCFSGGVFYRTSPTEPRVTNPTRASRTEVTRSITDAMPAYSAVMLGLAALSLLAAILIVVLLALPAANRFFRRRAPQPYPAPAYPHQFHPGQPYPGQPYPGQHHPGQGYPGQGYPGQGYPGQGYPGQGPMR
jgi:hypothetical protein